MARQAKLGDFKEKEAHEATEEVQGPYDLPEEWKWVKLSEVCKVNPSKSEIKDLPDDMEVTFVPMTAVSEVTGRIEKPEVRLLGEVKKGYTYFREGDVLFAKITPCMENGKSAIARNLINGVGFGSTEFHVLRPMENASSEWIHFYIRQNSFREEAARNMTGSVGQQRVPVKFLKQVIIPLPPLEEQKRIVSCLNELVNRAEEAKRLRKQAREEAEKIMQVALNKVFSRAEEEGWKCVRLGDIAEISAGGTPRRSFREYWNGDIPWVKILDIPEHGLVLDTEEKITEEGLKNSSAKIFPKGTILFSIFATIAKVGILGIDAATNQAIAGIQIKNVEIVDQRYLFYCLKNVGASLLNIGRGIAQRNVNQTILSNLEIPLSSIEKQKLIVLFLDKIQETIKSIKKFQQKTEEDLEKLVPAILDKAFRGEL